MNKPNEFGLTKAEEAALAAEYGAHEAAMPTAEQLKEYRLIGARMRAATHRDTHRKAEG